MGDRAFQIAAPLLWNKLPRSAREARNLDSFKTMIKTFLYKDKSIVGLTISFCQETVLKIYLNLAGLFESGPRKLKWLSK